MTVEILNDYRCSCGKLLFRGMVLTGSIEIKCRYCKRVETVDGLMEKGSDPDRYTLIIGREGEIYNSTQEASRALGYLHSELSARRVQDIVLLPHDEAYQSILQKLDGGQVSVLFHSFVKHKNRAMIPVQITACLFSTPDGQCILFNIEHKTVRNRAHRLQEA
ncbi:MAG: hypothetical protein AAB421_00665 [Patescibacteria group bacterium]